MGNQGRREIEPVIPLEGEVPLGTKIRVLRRARGLSITQLAQNAGDYRPHTISQVENNGQLPGADLLNSISRILGLESGQDILLAPREQVLEWWRSVRVAPKMTAGIEQAGGSRTEEIFERFTALEKRVGRMERQVKQLMEKLRPTSTLAEENYLDIPYTS